MTVPEESLAAAARLFDTVQHGDLDLLGEIFAEDAQVWHNTDNGLTDIPTTISNLKTIRETATIFSYEDIRRTATQDGFVQQHTLVVQQPGGPRIEDRACCVCTVKNGRICRMDAYHDSAATGAMAHKSPG
ncbi:MAG: ketosteroid isomerase [Citromicrobium sp.]|nr:ketosteroid isomerase [Citromicrobium sp.]